MEEIPGSLVGKQVGNYSATRLLGRGSMGEVYEGNHPILDRRVAIKVLSQDLSAYPELVSRFRREARAIARIKHPAIVEAFDFGNTSDGRSYYVMELLKGTNLSAFMLARGALSLDVAYCIALPLMEGLSTAHAAGFIHRDIKPDNIFIVTQEDGRPFPKLIDFGIAKLKNPDEQGDSVVTRIDAVMGTPLYMSPEQAPGATEPVGPWSDIYSTAATIFHMICGKPPFYSENPLELMLMHAWTAAPRAHEVRPEIPAAVSDVLWKALGKKPADRYASMQDFADALRAAAPDAASGTALPASAQGSTPSQAAPPQAAVPTSGPRLTQDDDEDPEDPSLGDTVMEGEPLSVVEGVLLDDEDEEAPRPEAGPEPAAAAPALAPSASEDAPRLEEGGGKSHIESSLSGVASEKILDAPPSSATLFQRKRFPWAWVLGGAGALAGAILAFALLGGPRSGAALPKKYSQLSAKTQHTCAVLEDRGEVHCWGRNNYGQLGVGDTDARNRPSQVKGLEGVRQVTTGGRHSCAIGADGLVHCWGRNGSGQLGDGTSTDRLIPVKVKGLGKAIAITAGADHSCALLEEGDIRCWGDNQGGQLGLDTAGQSRLDPQSVPDLKATVAIAAGGFHTCALAANGSVWCWGKNDRGQLGLGDLEPRAIPTKVDGLSDVLSLSASGSHSCVVTKGGAAHCWGDNASGQVGDGASSPQVKPRQVSGLPAVRLISAGGGYKSGHTCAVAEAGAIYCWGSNSAGQLGAQATPKKRPRPGQVSSLTGVRAISAGGRHTCALRESGELLCWGDNGDGQLGDGSGVNRAEPRAVR
ncbi:MAG: protein kinase [Polyangia bacterium]|jgi:serine/threonine-protein kinase|nr:protein kinase [Polyangia bacterium]